MSDQLPRRDAFPPDFLFGAATSAYQIEGQGFGAAGPTHWDTFAQQPGAISDGSSGAVACDHYHRFTQDLDLVAPFDAYRFSINWARVLPQGRGTPNPQGLDFYDRLVDAMLERDLRPFATLYHWEMPQALAALGGWQSRDVANWFGDYTETVLNRLGDRLASVATINEPFCVAWLGHFEGCHAPGLHDTKATARAMHHVLLAHGEAMIRMRAMGQRDLGIVLNFEATEPASDTHSDLTAAATRDAIFNRWYIEAILRGEYPKEALAGLEPYMPDGWQDDMASIAAPLDWLGVNYYTRARCKAAPDRPWPSVDLIDGGLDKTTMGWEVYPQGLGDLLQRLQRDYISALPIYITENGAAFDDVMRHGKVDDPQRLKFIARHLREVQKALKAGVNIKGYFYWSLLDNFEWAFGFEKRFGLVHVDYGSQQRTPKSSYMALVNAYGDKQCKPID